VTELTAIIPTRDRHAMLADCLATLAEQAVPSGFLEVIVVDDGSEPDLRAIVMDAAVRADAPGIAMRYARQDPAGLNAGRNHGAALARSDVFAYLDDDVLVSPGWARAVVDAFDTFGCDGLAGRTELLLEGDAPPWLSRKLRLYLAELDLGPHPGWLPEGSFPVGANCAVSRRGFERAGGFAHGLDRQGASLVSNGDTEFYLRLLSRDGKIAYAPDASVRHRVPPARLTVEYFDRRVYAQGVSDVLMTAPGGHSGLRDLGSAIGREALRAARAAPILARNLAAGEGTTGARLWLRYCAGRVAGLRRPVEAAR
jgi:glycosyltransferase involved in cell wall biosynthesis